MKKKRRYGTQGKVKLLVVSILVFLFLLSFFLIIPKIKINKENINPIFNKVLLDRTYIEELRKTDTNQLSNKKTGDKLSYKSYTSDTKEILIEDSNYKTIIKMKLTSPYVVSGLIASEDTMVAEFFLEDWKDGKTDLFDMINFYDTKNSYESTSKNFRLKYATEEQECYDLERRKVCENHTIWTEFKTLDELPNKNIKISLWANTEKSERIEWIPTIEGFNLFEWAAWNVVDAVYLQNFSVTAKETSPQGLCFSSDGTKMYVPGYGTETLNQYNLTMAWNISTAVYYYQITVGLGNPTGVAFKSDGAKMYVLSYGNQNVKEYSLATAWDISSASYVDSFDVSGKEGTPQGIDFKSDGTRMYIIGDTSGGVHEYNLTTAWDSSTGVFLQSFLVSTQDVSANGVRFKSDGKKMYVIGSERNRVFEYDLSTDWNVSTASYFQNVSVLSQDTGQRDLFFKSDGSKMYTVGATRDSVYEYDLGAVITDTPPTVTLHNPINDTNSTVSNIDFNCSGGDDQMIVNVSLYINGIFNKTKENGITNFTELNTTLHLEDGIYNWTCSAYDNATISQRGNTTVWKLTVDTGPPLINITYPYNIVNYQKLNNNLIINWSISDPNLDSCYGSYDEGLTNFSVNCLNNNITINVTSITNNNTFWLWANDTLENSANASNTWTYDIIENLQRYNSSSYETKDETFILNLTYNSSKTISTRLFYNGTFYAATKVGTGNNTLFVSVIDIPSITIPSNKSFYWETTLDTAVSYSPSSNQSIRNISFINCAPTDDVKYLNFSFKDESANIPINATAETTDFIYFLGSGTTSKTLTFVNSTDNFEYDFCFYPNDAAVYLDTGFRYSKTGYPTRTLTYDNERFTNSTTNKILYLLATVDGIYSSFQVLTNANQPISGVSVILSRYLSSVWTQISSGTTGADGIITFWNNPDLQYNYTFTKSGYDNYSILLYPTQASYTIYLAGGTTTTYNYTNYERGMNWKLSPPPGTELLNQTDYTFWFNLTSSYYSLDSFGMTMFGSGKYIGGNSSTSGSGGNLSYSLNTGANTSIIMTYYWIVNGNLTNKTSFLWDVFNTSDTQWSINNFFTDLKRYTNTTATGHGMFGMTMFSRTILIFVIMFISIGILSYYTGFTGLAPIMTMLFAELMLFDVLLGLIPAPSVGTITVMERGFPTLIAGLLMLGAWIKDWR